jgi:hypothetical protein
MTSRERTLAMVAAVMLGAAGLFVLVWFYQQWTTLDEKISTSNDQVVEAEAKIQKAKADAPKLEHWRRLSLSADIPTAKGEYKQFLINLMHKTGVVMDQFPPMSNDTKSTAILPSRNKQPIYTGLNFTGVRVKARMSNLVKFLEEFQKAPRMHRIKTMVIERTDNSAKKDPLGMTVTLGIEALIILDADKDINKSKAANDKITKAAYWADGLMGLRRGPIGLFTARWRVSPAGDVLLPLNPPVVSRNYADIANKNIFIPPPPYNEGPGTTQPTDEFVNRMKYNRFIGVVGRPDGKIEAKLWDASAGITSTRARADVTSGFNKIPMVMSGQMPLGDDFVQMVLVYGIVQKIEDRQMLLRVAINWKDADFTNWWRYPNDTNCYRLHKDDVADLVKKGKVRAEDKGDLYVFAKRYWSELEKDKKITMTGKYYSSHLDGSRGEVVYDEPSGVVIIRPESWPPQAPLTAAGVAVNRLYPDEYQIYGINEKHFGLMVANGTAKKEDIDDTYVMSAEYWDALRQDLLIKRESGNLYVIYKNLMKIEVLEQTWDMVVFKVPKKYCQFPGIAKTDEHPGTPPRWHEGFCVLKMDRMVQDALLEPLSEADVQKMLNPAPSTGTGGN